MFKFEHIYETCPDAILAKTVNFCLSLSSCLDFVCLVETNCHRYLFILGGGRANKIGWEDKSSWEAKYSTAAKRNPLVQIALLSFWSLGLLTNTDATNANTNIDDKIYPPVQITLLYFCSIGLLTNKHCKSALKSQF